MKNRKIRRIFQGRKIVNSASELVENSIASCFGTRPSFPLSVSVAFWVISAFVARISFHAPYFTAWHAPELDGNSAKLSKFRVDRKSYGNVSTFFGLGWGLGLILWDVPSQFLHFSTVAKSFFSERQLLVILFVMNEIFQIDACFGCVLVMEKVAQHA